jgi:UDP-N-acetylmuramate--alanine ligase
MEFNNIKSVYFVGIGGIGMSALARYFKHKAKTVSGYDLTETELTKNLVKEDIEIHYEDSLDYIKDLSKEDTLVIYTPAIPKDHKELNYFLENGYTVKKRAEVLGIISKDKLGIGVAGTHGKTSVSSMIAHLLYNSKISCDAILGGIANNYDSNLILSKNAETYIVLEADEFDRSFLQLNPYFSVITSLDADHLDIYKDKEDMKEAFSQFIRQTQDFGKLLINRKVLDRENLNPVEIHNDIESYTYSLADEADFYAKNIEIVDGNYKFDIVCPNNKRLENMTLSYPGLVNVENAIVACAVAYLSGAKEEKIREALLSFKGVKRRMEYKVKTPKKVYIDDYAHHPVELEASIGSMKKLYPTRKITGIFQPHLFTRTRDFVDGFAKSLSLLDEVILLDIYPARELPIEGVTSQIIFDKIETENKTLCTKEELLDILKTKDLDVLMTLGAGNIGEMVPQIENLIKNK